MKRIIWLSLVVALGIILVLFAVLPATATAPNGFAGNWEGTDPPPDLSTIRIQIMAERGSEGNAFKISGSDDMCTACGGEKALFLGAGVEHDTNVLSTAVVWWGLGASEDLFGPFLVEYTYDAAEDMIIDEFGNEFHRIGSQD